VKNGQLGVWLLSFKFNSSFTSLHPLIEIQSDLKTKLSRNICDNKLRKCIVEQIWWVNLNIPFPIFLKTISLHLLNYLKLAHFHPSFVDSNMQLVNLHKASFNNQCYYYHAWALLWPNEVIVQILDTDWSFPYICAPSLL